LTRHPGSSVHLPTSSRHPKLQPEATPSLRSSNPEDLSAWGSAQLWDAIRSDPVGGCKSSSARPAGARNLRIVTKPPRDVDHGKGDRSHQQTRQGNLGAENADPALEARSVAGRRPEPPGDARPGDVCLTGAHDVTHSPEGRGYQFATGSIDAEAAAQPGELRHTTGAARFPPPPTAIALTRTRSLW
jgi:hypothetical protein